MSLRVKVVIGVALPLIIFLFLNSYLQYEGAHRSYVREVELISTQIGEIIRSSLHQSMLTNDKAFLERSVADVSKIALIRNVQIIDLHGEVKTSSNPANVGNIHLVTEAGCNECHQLSSAQRPTAARLTTGSGLLRIASPIKNEPVCDSCHDSNSANLGLLLVDVSTDVFDTHLMADLRQNLIYSFLGVGAIVLFIFFLINHQVVRRVEALRKPIAAYADGDFSARPPLTIGTADELTDLASSFDHMANELERHKQEQEKSVHVQTQAIIQERERIARELHDGLGQLIGYVNTKAYTVRLLLKKAKNEEAEKELTKLEEAAQGLFIDMREAVLSLRMAAREDDLPSSLKYCVDQFSRLSGVTIRLKIAPEMENFTLDPEVQLHLMRITQEALSNARKYARATRIEVNLCLIGDNLNLVVSDNGSGFDKGSLNRDTRPHFGLSTMRERAEAIGGQLTLLSQSGSGTSIDVLVPLKGI